MNHLKREGGTGRRVIELVRTNKDAIVKEVSNREKARRFRAVHPEYANEKDDSKIHQLIKDMGWAWDAAPPTKAKS